MNCDCGFEFSGAGEFRNCQAFITADGQGGVVCPKCGQRWINGIRVKPPQSREFLKQYERFCKETTNQHHAYVVRMYKATHQQAQPREASLSGQDGKGKVE